MSSRSPLEQSLRRLKPEKHIQGLALRDRSKLLFLTTAQPTFQPLLLDTTVYIDTLQGKLPLNVKRQLQVGIVWHSTVTEAELSALAGLLDPQHAGTRTVIAQVAASIDLRPSHRILAPDREVWREAGILAGLLARIQRYNKGDQRKAFNDALIFLTAAKHGCSVLTRNITEFDMLMQLDRRGRAIFYDQL